MHNIIQNIYPHFSWLFGFAFQEPCWASRKAFHRRNHRPSGDQVTDETMGPWGPDGGSSRIKKVISP